MEKKFWFRPRDEKEREKARLMNEERKRARKDSEAIKTEAERKRRENQRATVEMCNIAQPYDSTVSGVLLSLGRSLMIPYPDIKRINWVVEREANRVEYDWILAGKSHRSRYVFTPRIQVELERDSGPLRMKLRIEPRSSWGLTIDDINLAQRYLAENTKFNVFIVPWGSSPQELVHPEL